MAGRKFQKRRNARKKNKVARFPSGRARINTVVTRGSVTIGFLKLFRLAITTLPIDGALKSAFDVVFNLIYKTIATVNNNTGAFAMFGVTPGCMMLNSPYLAVNGAKYSFPGHPVSMKYINVVLRNTTKRSEFSGRWAAVLIPYREGTDKTSYQSILKDLTFAQTVAMPYARSATADRDMSLCFRMRDKTNFCARPRQLTDEIAVVYVIWDTAARDSFVDKLTNSSFNCEIELHGGCIPHEIFGPQHRVDFDSDAFKIRSITDGSTVRVHDEGGRVSHVSSEAFYGDFAMIDH